MLYMDLSSIHVRLMRWLANSDSLQLVQAHFAESHTHALLAIGTHPGVPELDALCRACSFALQACGAASFRLSI